VFLTWAKHYGPRNLFVYECIREWTWKRHPLLRERNKILSTIRAWSSDADRRSAQELQGVEFVPRQNSDGHQTFVS
jgi:hypothetical protein